ncbi:MAG TPA: AAA family ATPase, partial [Kofleriaceae bacterium]|nr:AAA family ATPase [Kofleriaceae bacterium]
HRSGFAADIRRLKQEFRSVADLLHPNLVGLHELSSDGKRWFFTMDLVAGHDFLAHARAVDLAGLRAALRQLATGIDALHAAGIVHRDIKPSNVLVDRDGRVVILDFGLAGAKTPAETDDLVGGTPDYMAPEQAAGAVAGPPADWYAVGVMLHEALTGRRPSPARLPAALPGAPADLERLCLHLLAADPVARPDGAEVLAALGGQSVAAVDARPIDRGRTLVGRAQELATLRDAYRAVLRGIPQVVRVVGQPGVGKSALLASFLQSCAAEGALIIEARCHERESVPFKAFDGVADALTRYLRGLSRSQAAALMPRDIHLCTQLFPVFDGLPAIADVPRRTGHGADPRENRMRAFAAFKELVARIGDKQPLVIAIDDLQWSDVDSARLLAQLVAVPERPALALVLCHRDEADRGPIVGETLRMIESAGAVVTELALGPLPPAEAERLALRLVGVRTAAVDLARSIATRCEGHPLFMAELARAVCDQDVPAGTPPRLIDILWQRVVHLSEAARALLETVAVAGQPLPAALCIEAAGLGARGLDAVRVLRAEQLLRAGDRGAINVYHDRIRDAVLLHADAGDQRARHLALARALERSAAADAELLAHHFDAGGAPEEAARQAIRGGDEAMAALAFERAAALYRMAVRHGGGDAPPAELRRRLADALLNAGANIEAGETYLAAAELAEGAQATDLVRLGGEQLLQVGDREAGYRALHRALADVGERLPRTMRRARFELIYHILRLRFGRRRFRERPAEAIAAEQLLRLDVLYSAFRGLDDNDPEHAMALRGRFCRLALRIGEPRRAAIGLIHSAFALAGGTKGYPRAVDEVLDAGEALGARFADPRLLGEATLVRGMIHLAMGDFPRAASFCERAASIMAEQCTGVAHARRLALLNLADGHLRTGALGPARRVADELLLDASERRDPVAEKNICGGVLAPLALAADDVRGAEEMLGRCGTEDRCVSIMFRAETTSMVANYRGRPDDAVAAWRQRWTRIREMGVLYIAGFRVLTVRSLATALLARNQGRR